MQLKLGDALAEIDCLQDAKVVGGSGGLGNSVRWAHVVDLPEVAPWVREGDLYLTTAFAMRDNPQALRELIPILAQKGVAGMIVALGPYFSAIPEEMTALADELDFPIVTLPWEVPFVEVTQSIHEKILSLQFSLVEQSLNIHKELTDLVLQGKGFADLVQTLALLINRSVTIEDANLRVIAYASPGAVDEVRQRSIAEGETPRELVAFLEEQGLFQKLRKDPRPQYVPPIPKMGMTLERMIAPIMVGSELFGYVWIIATEGSLTDLDYLTIERVATVAALTFTREQAVYEAEQRLKSSLLDNLLDPDPSANVQELSQILHQLGLRQGYQIFMIEQIDHGPVRPAKLTAIVERAVCELGISNTVIQRGQRLVGLIGTKDADAGERAAARVIDAGSENRCDLILGLSAPYEDPSTLTQAYRQAGDALRLAKQYAGKNPGSWSIAKLGFLPWMSSITPDMLSSNRYYQVIQDVAEQDRETGSDFLITLETFLAHRGNKQRSAQELFIHRNTLRQRLERISSIWRLDLDDPFVCLNLEVALLQKRISGDRE